MKFNAKRILRVLVICPTLILCCCSEQIPSVFGSEDFHKQFEQNEGFYHSNDMMLAMVSLQRFEGLLESFDWHESLKENLDDYTRGTLDRHRLDTSIRLWGIYKILGYDELIEIYGLKVDDSLKLECNKKYLGMKKELILEDVDGIWIPEWKTEFDVAQNGGQ